MDNELSFKIIIIGNSGVGKTSLLLKFVTGKFDPDTTVTVGADISSKRINLGDCCVHLNIWDTSGQERFSCIIPSLYRGAQGVILVYDVTDYNSFLRTEHWMAEACTFLKAEKYVKMIIGNKADLENREVSRDEGLALAKKYKCLFFECSAMTDSNIEKAFYELTRQIIEIPCLWKPPSDVIYLENSSEKKSNCCIYKYIKT